MRQPAPEGGGEQAALWPGGLADKYNQGARMPPSPPQPDSPSGDVPELAPDAEDRQQSATAAQPDPKDRVTEDMATLAIHNPKLYDEAVTDTTPRMSGDFAGMEDAEIMLALSAGNMAAFDVLVQKYRKPIIHFMFRMVHNEAVAEELAQEVFLRVYRSRATYRAEARFSTWLYRIATNLGVNHARDTRHERTAPTVYLDEPDPRPGPRPTSPTRPRARRAACCAASGWRDPRARHGAARAAAHGSLDA